MENLRTLVTDNLRDYLHDGLGLNEIRAMRKQAR